MLLATAATLATGTAHGATRIVPPAGSPELFEAYVRVRGSLAEAPVFEHTWGWTYGVVDGESPRLLWISEGLTISRYRRAARDRVLGRTGYLGLMRDAATGRVLERFDNPYTGDTVEVPASQHDRDIASIELTPSGTHIAGAPAGPGLQPLVNGAHISFTDRLVVPLPPKAQPKLDIATLTAQADEAFDASRLSVLSTLSFTGIERWRPWMRMSERPGGLLWHVIGGKVSREEVAPELLQRARALWHESLDAP